MEIEFPDQYKRVLVTGGAGFIGGSLIRKLLNISDCLIFNIDKMGYASDLTSIEQEILKLGAKAKNRFKTSKIDLYHKVKTSEAIKAIDPDIVFHLAAESHVDRSIAGPEIFIKSNIMGTFNLLEAVKEHWESLNDERRDVFRMHHISTDEVFGSLGAKGKFTEKTAYNPRSPYSASKASSDHLVSAWNSTYGLPTIITNCSNNYGPWQMPEKLIPLVIIKAINNQKIPIYGDGKNIRDWLHVEDHVDAIILAATKGTIGSKYCIGGCNERSNIDVVKLICEILNDRIPKDSYYEKQISFVKDRLGHDHRYAIDNLFISNKLAWTPRYSFENGLIETIDWYLNNLDWCKSMGKYSS